MSPINSSLAGASVKGFGMFGGSDKSWMSYLADARSAATQGTISNAVCYDKTGNSYSAGQFLNVSGGGDGYVAKYNSSGTIVWQRWINALYPPGAHPSSIFVDSSYNVYVAGYTSKYSGGTYYNAFVIKYDLSGTAVWKKELSKYPGASVYANAVAVDTSGNVYVAGQSGTAGFLVKYNSSGTIQWNRDMSSSNVECLSVALDASGNPYVSGTNNGGGGAGACVSFIAKYDTTGSLIWQTDLAGKITAYTFESTGKSISIDPSGNVFTAGTYWNASNGKNAFVAKYNSSGVLQWQRSLSNASLAAASQIDIANSVYLDFSGNVFVAGISKTSTTNEGFVAKYNNSGTLQWQVKIYGSGTNAEMKSVAVNTSGSINIGGLFMNTSSGTNALVSKLNSYSIVNQTYTIDATHPVTIAAGTLTDAAGSLSSLSYTVTDGGGGSYDTTVSYGDLTASLTTATLSV